MDNGESPVYTCPAILYKYKLWNLSTYNQHSSPYLSEYYVLLKWHMAFIINASRLNM